MFKRWTTPFYISCCIFVILACQAPVSKLRNPSTTATTFNKPSEMSEDDNETPEVGEDEVSTSVSPGENSGSNTFTDANSFYTISYPEGWIVQKAGSEQHFCMDANNQKCMAISLRIKSVSLQSLLSELSQQFGQEWSQYQESESENVTLSGSPGIWIDQAYVGNGVDQKGFMAAVVRNRIGYLLMGWAPAQEYPELKNIFRPMAESLQIIDYGDSPDYQFWQTFESEHFIFYFPDGSWVEPQIEDIASQHEKAFIEIVNQMMVDYAGPISMYLYPSKEALFRSTARESGFAINEASEVHALWVSADDHQSLGHEMTHVISFWTWGQPGEALMGEGLAVCLDQSGKNLRQINNQMLAQGKLISLDKMLGDAWFDVDPEVAYPESGALACYLLEKYLIVEVQDLYSASDFKASVESQLDTDVPGLQSDWIDWLKGE
jgi:hypothetical protein